MPDLDKLVKGGIPLRKAIAMGGATQGGKSSKAGGKKAPATKKPVKANRGY